MILFTNLDFLTIFFGMKAIPALDSIDRQLLRLLQEDARVSNAELARQVGLSPGPTFERIQKLERLGYIRGYLAVLDPERMGYGLTVLVSVALSAHQLQSIHEFRAAVDQIPEVRECHHLTGDTDFLLQVAVADVRTYQELLAERLCRLPGVQTIRSAVVLSTIKRDLRVPVPEDPS